MRTTLPASCFFQPYILLRPSSLDLVLNTAAETDRIHRPRASPPQHWDALQWLFNSAGLGFFQNCPRGSCPHEVMPSWPLQKVIPWSAAVKIEHWQLLIHQYTTECSLDSRELTHSYNYINTRWNKRIKEPEAIEMYFSHAQPMWEQTDHLTSFRKQRWHKSYSTKTAWNLRLSHFCNNFFNINTYIKLLHAFLHSI